MVEITYVQSREEYAAASELFKEYALWLNIDLSFQNFDEELRELSDMYGGATGCIILAKFHEAYVGCIGVRKIDGDTAEVKRMYVKPVVQHHGIGTLLLKEALRFAKAAGYARIRLDTLNTMLPAMRLYEKAGFYKIPAYYFNPQPTAVYFEKMVGDV